MTLLRRAALLLFALSTAASAELPLISRALLLGNPERSSPRISPDGTRIAFSAPDKKDVLQVFVQTIGKDDARMICWSWGSPLDHRGLRSIHAVRIRLSAALKCLRPACQASAPLRLSSSPPSIARAHRPRSATEAAMSRRSAVLQLVFACLLAAACGGGGGSSPTPTPTPTPGSGGPPAPVGGPDAGTPGGNGGPARFAVVVATNGSGRITSTPAGIDCGTACSASFDAGTHVSLAAAPAAGWHLDGWGGACSGPGGCDVIAASDRTVWATFLQDPPPPPPPPPPANSCADIAPPADVAMRQYVQSPASGGCMGAAGDSGGTMAFASVVPAPAHGATVDFVSTSGTFLQHSSGLTSAPSLLQQPVGVAAIAGASPYSGPPNAIYLSRWDHSGGYLSPGARYGSRSRVVAAPNPGGGFLLAGDAAESYSGPTQHAAAMIAGSTTAFTTLWTKPLASAGAVFGAGVDLRGRSLVITDGAAKFGGGAISGQWFDSDGTALTGEFLLVSNFTPGASTWFEASPLVGSGLLVRRVDADHKVTELATWYHSQALLVVASGAGQASAAPGWMVSHRDVQFALARNNRAYATLPYGAPGVACSQRVEVLAADGTSCGARDYPIAAGTCDTGDLGLGMDGTVIQPLPLSMETTQDIHGAHTCTWRWWAGAIR